MTRHLSPREFTDCMDGTLRVGRQAHIDACPTCRAKLADLQNLVHQAQQANDLPEPSPLFWEHFSRRVQAATEHEPIAPPRSFWTPGWRPLVGVLTAVAAVAITVALRLPHQAPPAATLDASVAPASVVDNEATLSFVAGVAATLPFEDVRQAAQPTPDATDALVEQLSAEQRAELARLVQERMRGGE
jgi:hypothetical protein